MRRAPGSCDKHDPGARIYICVAKAERLPSYPAEAKSTPGSPGRGFLCAILADPQTNARAGRNPSLKILPRQLSRPTLRPARARRPRPPPRRAAHGPRRRRPDVPGPVTRRGTGGASRELPHLQVPDAGRGPADRTGGGCAPETPDRWLRRPPPRHRRRPPPHPDRPAGARGPVLLRPGRCQLLARRRGRSPPGSIATRAPSDGPCAGSRTSATSAGSSPGRTPPAA